MANAKTRLTRVKRPMRARNIGQSREAIAHSLTRITGLIVERPQCCAQRRKSLATARRSPVREVRRGAPYRRLGDFAVILGADFREERVAIRAVMFDFGGVISTSPFEAFAGLETEHGRPPGF